MELIFEFVKPPQPFYYIRLPNQFQFIITDYFLIVFCTHEEAEPTNSGYSGHARLQLSAAPFHRALQHRRVLLNRFLIYSEQDNLQKQ